ncbi:MAG TPA: hypothetical protein PKK26_07180 [Candidatus Wallbacteria bacterium]|nr:hypothetical protein [Candidatus Wallbacteria bacterium]
MKKDNNEKEIDNVQNDIPHEKRNSVNTAEDVSGPDFNRLFYSIGICLILLMAAKLLGW